MGESDSEHAGDKRLPIAAAGGLLLVTLVGLLLLTRDSSEGSATVPPPRCVSLWNADSKALAFGRHNFRSHRYAQAEVAYVDRAGNLASRGSCAVVFPADALDPEPFAAARVQRGGRWLPLGKALGVDAVRLAELQAEAVDGFNAALLPDGTLDPVL